VYPGVIFLLIITIWSRLARIFHAWREAKLSQLKIVYFLMYPSCSEWRAMPSVGKTTQILRFYAFPHFKKWANLPLSSNVQKLIVSPSGGFAPHPLTKGSAPGHRWGLCAPHACHRPHCQILNTLPTYPLIFQQHDALIRAGYFQRYLEHRKCFMLNALI